MPNGIYRKGPLRDRGSGRPNPRIDWDTKLDGLRLVRPIPGRWDEALEDAKAQTAAIANLTLRSRRRHMRFQRFLKLLRGARDGSTAGLAMEAGYADQAHLGRESRRLAVTTPQRIAALLAGRPAQ